MYKRIVILLSFSLLADTICGQDTTYYYRPYPVLLVHGFNSSPHQTFGAMTYKEGDEAPDRISTKIQTEKSVETVLENEDGKPNIAKSLVQALDPQNRLIGTVAFRRPDAASFKDFYREKTSIPIEYSDPNRHVPAEEQGSYDSINHTFVEYYCSYFKNESDDGDGVKYPSFRCENGGSAFNLNRWGDLGGQSQLLRIRIIQLLNEYYGDWKWVGDPTAKVKLVVHSNGGMLVAHALKNDSLYWDDGNVYYEGWWNPPLTGYYGYSHQGSGFRLADHIDQVITIDTPHKGSPFASADGNPSDLSYQLIVAPLVGYAEILYFAKALALLKGSWTAVVFSKVATISYAASMFLLLDMELVYDFVGGSDSPLIRDLAPDGTVVKNYTGAKPPTYTNGNQVPYLNHIGSAPKKFAAIYTPVIVSSPKLAAYHIVRGITCLWRPRKAAVEFGRAGILIWATQGAVKAHKWMKNSDLIVSEPSQDIRSIFPQSNRVIKRSEMIHTDQHTLASVIPEWVAGESDISVTHAIGALQQGEESYDILPQVKNSLITHKYCGQHSCYADSEYVDHYNQEFVRFHGCNPATPVEQQWLKSVNDTIQVSELVTGKPKIIAGKLVDYYMNCADVKLKVNQNSWQNLQFYQDFGKWAGRRVDINGDGLITSSDKPEGALFFAGVDTADFLPGENVVAIKLINKFKEEKTHTVSVMCGPKLEYYESNYLFEPENEILGRALQWDINTNEQKSFYIRYLTPLDVTNSLSSIGLLSETAENVFTRTTNAPASGQYTLVTSGKYTYSQVSIDPGELKTENGEITSDQVLHLSLVTNDGNPRNAFSKFYIDNEPPSIKIQSPILLSDYNRDGLVDSNDSCSTTLDSVPYTDCHAQCDTISDAVERALALQMCEQTNHIDPVIHNKECDGIDNDFDGFIDEQDKSEYESIRYYSPAFDNNDSLISEAVSVDFTINDNIQHFVKKPFLLQWRIYKVNGYDMDTLSDQLVYHKTLSGEKSNLPATVSDLWSFEPYNHNHLPPDGLYAMTVLCVDEAENATISAPAYFIIDKKSPSITIIKDWQDELGNSSFEETSGHFGCLYMPGNGTGYFDQFDSETEEVFVEFIPEGRYRFLAFPFTTTVYPTYDDQYSITADGEIDTVNPLVPDGKIDPSRISIPNVEFKTRHAFFHGFGANDIINIPDDSYTIRLTAKDRAGNTTVYYNPDKLININRGQNTLLLNTTDLAGGDSVTINYTEDAVTISSKTIENSQPGASSETNYDEGIFNSQKISGDFEFTTQIQNMPICNENEAFSGVMVRRLPASHVEMVALLVDKNGMLIVRERYSPNRPLIETPLSGNFTLPNIYIKVKKVGNNIVFLTSADGVSFTEVYSTVYNSETTFVGTYFENKSDQESGTTIRYGFGENPFGDIITNIDEFSLFATDTILLADRVKVHGKIGAGAYIEMGAQAVCYENLYCSGDLFMRELSSIEDTARITGIFSKQNLFSIGTFKQCTNMKFANIPVKEVNSAFTDTIIPNNASVTLVPGIYGNLRAYSNSIIRLEAGVYHFRSVTLEPGVQVITNPGTGIVDLRISASFSMGDRCRFYASNTINHNQNSIYIGGSALSRIGCQTFFNGCITAPHAPVEISAEYTTGANFKGTVHARKIKIYPDVSIVE